jgi:hypothetical protein
LIKTINTPNKLSTFCPVHWHWLTAKFFHHAPNRSANTFQQPVQAAILAEPVNAEPFFTGA